MHMTLKNPGMSKFVESARFLLKGAIVMSAAVAMTFFISRSLADVADVNAENQTVAGYVQYRSYQKENWDQRVKRIVQEHLAEVDRAGGVAKIKDQQVLCLAQNVYFESRGQPLAGQVGVAKVTLNRLDEGYARTVCGVVRQRLVPDTCQFSWVCNNPNPQSRVGGHDWRLAVGIALATLFDGEHIQDPTNGATHFHATYVRPDWSRLYTQASQIGDHVFYRRNNR